MRAQPEGMVWCSACKRGPADRVILSDGDPRSPLVLLGEAPGKTEVEEGQVFVGPSGKLLRWALQKTGLSRWRPWITNPVKCGGLNPRAAEVDACVAAYCAQELSTPETRVIVAMGAWAQHATLGLSTGVQERMGRLVETRLGKVVCTCHPAAVLRNPDLLGQWLQTLRFAAAVMGGEDRTSEPPATEVLLDSERAEDVLLSLASFDEVAVDIETTGLDPRRDELIGIALCAEPGRSYWLPAPMLKDRYVADAWRDFWRGPTAKVLHNATFDTSWPGLLYHDSAGVVYDTMVEAHLADENWPMGLKQQAQLRLSAPDWTEGLDAELAKVGKGATFADVPEPVLTRYAGCDAHYTLLLHRELRPDWSSDERRPAYELVRNTQALMLRASGRGALVDVGNLRVCEDLAASVKSETERSLRDFVGDETFNPGSTKQLSEMLFKTLKLKPVKETKAGGDSTDAESLGLLQKQAEKSRPDLVPFLGELLRYRRACKLGGTFVPMIEREVSLDGAIHATFKVASTRTGRLSCASPNLQQMPTCLRPLLVARPGYVLLDCDYSQLEVRVLAGFSRDPELLRIIREADAAKAAGETALDMHRFMASMLYEVDPRVITYAQRQVGKVVVFSQIYGKTEKALAEMLGSEELAHKIVELFRTRFGVAGAWIRRVKAAVRKAPHSMLTPTGRRRRLPAMELTAAGVEWSKGTEAHVLRQAVNSPVQGTASDVNNYCANEAQRAVDAAGLDTHLLLLVHDATVWEVPEDRLDDAREVIVAELERPVPWPGCDVPFKVDWEANRHWHGELSLDDLHKWMRSPKDEEGVIDGG